MAAFTGIAGRDGSFDSSSLNQLAQTETLPITHKRNLWLLILAAMLLMAAISRWIETDGGNTLIHEIPVEVDEFTFLPGKIYRPIEARSLDRKPAVLIFDGLHHNADGLSAAAVQFLKQGFAVLAIGSRQQVYRGQPSAIEPTTAIKAGFGLLSAQPFIDQDQIGLLAINLDPLPLPIKGVNFKSISQITAGSNTDPLSLTQNPLVTFEQKTAVLKINHLKKAQAFLSAGLNGTQTENKKSEIIVLIREILTAGCFLLLIWLICDLFAFVEKPQQTADTANGLIARGKAFSRFLFLSGLFYLSVWASVTIFGVEFRFLHVQITPLDFSGLRPFLWRMVLSFAVFFLISRLFRASGIKKETGWQIIFCLLLGILIIFLAWFPDHSNDAVNPLLASIPSLRPVFFSAACRYIPLIAVFLLMVWQLEINLRKNPAAKLFILFYSTIFAWILISSAI